MKQFGKLAKAYCVERGKHFKLKDFDPADTGGIRSKERAAAALQKSLEQLADLQGKLYAQDQWAVLLIFQGMDASGKAFPRTRTADWSTADGDFVHHCPTCAIEVTKIERLTPSSSNPTQRGPSEADAA